MQPIIPFIVEVDDRAVETARVVSVDSVKDLPPVGAVSQERSSWSLSRAKRIFDIVISLGVIAGFWLPMLLIAVCIRLTSRGPALFVQRRVGQDGRLFTIYKFRSMTVSKLRKGAGLTMAGDARVTAVGKWLRIFKLDELPQFYNVLRGDMSIVGPRPKLPEYAEELNFAYRPGLTGAASLAFRREEEILAQVHVREVESFYQSRIKPLKARIDERYMAQASLRSDLRIILSTFLCTIMPNRYPALRYHDLNDPSEQEGFHADKRHVQTQPHSLGDRRSVYSRVGIGG